MEHLSHTAQTVGTITALLMIAAATLSLCKRFKIPFTVTLVVVGIALASLADAFPATFSLLGKLEISPDLILFVFLPTLIFESAFHLDARMLRRDLLPVLTLAVPGVLLSTVLIGCIVWFLTSIELPAALLLGAILSATDPVAVISLFKQLGAPKRLTVLVEGESLLNDATSIVVARILTGIALAGVFSGSTLISGIGEFLLVFLGGVLVGWLLGLAVGHVLGKVESDPYIEISLTTIVAYLSFFIAEAVFHVSGVMATVAAGIVLGGWGQAKISPSVRHYLESFWEYAAYVANALIFLLVGLQVDLAVLGSSAGWLTSAIFAMLVARAIVVYTLVPLVGRMPGSEYIDRSYQHVMYWGGLRGAIALAIVLSLPDFQYAEIFIALVLGSVLFTLLVQGLSIGTLVKHLALDRLSYADRLARVKALLAARQRGLHRVAELENDGFVSSEIAERLKAEYAAGLQRLEAEIDRLRHGTLDRNHRTEEERRQLFLRAFATENALYLDLFNTGQLRERTYRDLTNALQLEMEEMRYFRRLPQRSTTPEWRRRLEQILLPLLERIPRLCETVKQWRIRRAAQVYALRWARLRGSDAVLQQLKTTTDAAPSEIIAIVRGQYSRWRGTAKRRLDELAEQYPEIILSIQERQARRLLLLSQLEVIRREAEQGALSEAIAQGLANDIAAELRRLHVHGIDELKITATELRRKATIFASLSDVQFQQIAQQLRLRTFGEREIILHQGRKTDALLLIARGIVHMSRPNSPEAHAQPLETLKAGDYCGEISLLEDLPSPASFSAITPCFVYELRRGGLEAAMGSHPAIREQLQATARRRLALLKVSVLDEAGRRR